MKRKSAILLLAPALLATVLPLSGCESLSSMFGQNKAKTAHVKPQHAPTTEAYVTTLSLSRIALAANPGDMDTAATAVSTLKSYNNSKHRKAETLTLAVIDYRVNGGATQHAIAPVVDKKSELPSLQAVMDKINSASGTLQNIALVSANVAPDKSLVIPDDPMQIAPVLEAQQQTILAHSHPLSPYDNIRRRIALLEFFTAHQFRDAAYLTLDNVKRELAQATQNKTLDEGTINGFSANIDALESNLKKQLPYGF